MPKRPRGLAAPVLRPVTVAAALLVAGGAVASTLLGRDVALAEPALLAPVRAVPARVDTLFLGGYAQGSFAEAVQALNSDLSAAERTMIGRHLDRIFGDILSTDGLGGAGRLRLAYERTVRPDGSTRAIRVLAAEAAVQGQIHTAFFFDRDGSPGYFDRRGQSLDPRAWAQPLSQLRVSSPFGLRRMHPILHRVLPHTGVDYAAAPGTPVRATADGSVASAGRRGGYGNLVEIQHPNGYVTRYAHLSRIEPGIGAHAVVRQGDVIGYVGMTGQATGPHLHYELRAGGRPVDPAGVSVALGPSADLGSHRGWARERRELSGLLSRTPTLLSTRRGDARR